MPFLFSYLGFFMAYFIHIEISFPLGELNLFVLGIILFAEGRIYRRFWSVEGNKNQSFAVAVDKRRSLRVALFREITAFAIC